MIGNSPFNSPQRHFSSEFMPRGPDPVYGFVEGGDGRLVRLVTVYESRLAGIAYGSAFGHLNAPPVNDSLLVQYKPVTEAERKKKPFVPREFPREHEGLPVFYIERRPVEDAADEFLREFRIGISDFSGFPFRRCVIEGGDGTHIMSKSGVMTPRYAGQWLRDQFVVWFDDEVILVPWVSVDAVLANPDHDLVECKPKPGEPAAITLPHAYKGFRVGYLKVPGSP